MRNCRNTLRICKFFDERGEIIKPDCNEEFHIKVESCSQKRYYSLNPENCFCVTLEGLGNETFCITEDSCDEYETRYMIDGHCCDHACIDFEDGDFHQIAIINKPLYRYGNLCIHARIEDACGNKMDNYKGFKVKISGCEYEQVVSLNASNCFHICLDEIPTGEYSIFVNDMEDFDVGYRFNGCVEDSGCILLEGGENNLDFIAHFNNPTHYARVSRWCRTSDGRLVRPVYDQCFDIRVGNRRCTYREFTLNCENHFTEVLEGNRDDVFEIELMDACDVVYEVDGVMVDCVKVRMDEDHDIRIIDGEGCECSNDKCSKFDCSCCEKECCMDERGTLVITKWISDDGCLVKPSKGEVFYVRIQGYSNNPMLLGERNNFTITLDDIKPGYYQVEEDSDCCYDVYYKVNGEIQEDGYIYVDNQCTTNVDVINVPVRKQNEKHLHIMKRFSGCSSCGKDEDLSIPDSGIYEVSVKGPKGKKCYTLCEENDYEVTIPVCDGQYVITEMNSCGRVTYIVDGKRSGESAVIEVCDMHHEVIVVNHRNTVNFVI